MEFRGDRRGQAVMVGAVLLLAIFVIGLAIVQSQVLPDENRQVEFEHSQQVQGEIQELRNAILRAGSVGTAQPQSIRLGTRYPQRTLTINPPPASGTLSVDSLGEDALRIENATAVGDLETRDYWNGSTKTFRIGQLRYEPSYNEYANAPETVYESSVVYNEFDDGEEQFPLTGQRLIDGRTISLITFDGSLSENEIDRVSVDPQAVSVSTRTVTIGEDDDEDPIVLEFESDLPVAEWEELLDSEMAPDGNVVAIETTENGDIRIELDGEEKYNLRMGLVTTGNPAGSETDATYVTDVRGTDETVTAGGSGTRLVVEARDRFNNPVSGVEIEDDFEDRNNVGSLEAIEPTTDSEGQAIYRYEPPESVTQTESVAFDLFFGDREYEEVSFDLTVVNATTGDGEGVDGPLVRDVTAEPSTVSIGQSFDLDATVDSVGTEEHRRTGTPIQSAEWKRVGDDWPGTEIATFTPDDPEWSAWTDVSTTIEARDLGATVGEWFGDHDLRIRGQDATGRWSPGADEGETTITVRGVNINFQPETADIPEGYIPDYGDELGERESGLTYGWIDGDNEETRERETDPDLRRDTLIHMDHDTAVNEEWEIELPDGFYNVTLVMGDPDYDDSNHSVRIGDTLLVDEEGVGGSNFVTHEATIEVTDGTLRIVGEGENEKLAYIDIETADPPDADPAFFEVTIDDTNSPVTEGDTLEVTATIENTGDLDDTQDVTLSIDGSEVDSQELSIDGGDDETILLEWETQAGDAGEYTATVESEDDDDTATVTVQEPDQPFFDVTITDAPEQVTEGDEVVVEYTIENTGDETATQDIQFLVDDEEIDTEDGVELESGDTFDGEFTYETDGDDVPSIDVTVASDDDSDTATVTVDSLDPDAELAIDDFEDQFPDGVAPEDYGEVTITVEEQQGVSTENLAVTLTIVGDEEGQVFEETIDDRELDGESDEFVFDVGEIETADAYTATVTANADNADEVTRSAEFTIEQEATPLLSNLNIADQGDDATVTEGEAGDVEVDVENVGDQSGTFTIELEIENGDTVAETETTSELGPGDSETVTFDDPISGLSPDEYDVTVVDSAGISPVTGSLAIDEDAPDPPTFDTLSAEASGPGGLDRLDDIAFEGAVSNVDNEGTIQFELEDNGDTYYTQEIDMAESFDVDESFGGADRRDVPIEVRVTLLDSEGEPYEMASGTFTDNNEELTLDEGLDIDTFE